MTVPGRRFSTRGPRRGISATRRNGLQNHHSMAQRNVVQTRLQTSAQSGGVTTMDFWTTLRVGIGELSSTSEKLQGCGPSYQRTPSRRAKRFQPFGATSSRQDGGPSSPTERSPGPPRRLAAPQSIASLLGSHESRVSRFLSTLPRGPTDRLSCE